MAHELLLALVLSLGAAARGPRSRPGTRKRRRCIVAPRTAGAAEGAPGRHGSAAPIGLGRIGDIEFAPGMTNRGAMITSGNPPHDRTRRVGVQRRLLAPALERCVARAMAASCGPVRKNSGRSPTDDRESRKTSTVNFPLRGTTASVASPTPNTTGTPPSHGIVRVPGLRSGLLPGDERRRVPSAPPTAGSPAKPCPRRTPRLGPFTCTGTATRCWRNRIPKKAIRSRACSSSKGRLYESVRIGEHDKDESEAQQAPLHAIDPEGSASVFEALTWEELPLYETGEFPAALDFLHLSAGEELLWAAAGPQKTPEGSKPGQVTVAREAGGGWLQLLGPEKSGLSGKQPFPEMTVTTLAAEPRTESAWLGLDSPSRLRKSHELQRNRTGVRNRIRACRAHRRRRGTAERRRAEPAHSR